MVNDRSTDHTALVASAFGDRIMLLRNLGHGANVARNRVLKEARGEWVQYLDADDYLLPQKIEQQLLEADGGAEADVLYSPVLIEETHGETATRRPSELHADSIFSANGSAGSCRKPAARSGGAMRAGIARRLARGSAVLPGARALPARAASRACVFSARRRRARSTASGRKGRSAAKTRA